MQYEEVICSIEKKRRFGSLPGVDVSRILLAAVGNPQKELAFVHIAGTNGKGSTAAFLCSILTEAGISAGLFTSPHLNDFTERIRIGGRKIPREDAARIGERLLNLKLEMMPCGIKEVTPSGYPFMPCGIKEVTPTMFDYCLAMALLYFKEQGCRIVVLETGLGGRLDSTNVIDAPLVSIITKIGCDHTAVLGETLTEIAEEKAGILKTGTRAVFESQTEAVMDVLCRSCFEKGIRYQIVDTAQIVPEDGGFSYPGETPYGMRLLGAFQRENAMAAVLAARELKSFGYPITEESLHRGVEMAVWEGRMEIVCKNPFLMVDGAHNRNGVRALVKSLSELYPNEKFHFIMGVLADKDYEDMVKEILPVAGRVTVVTPKSERALSGGRLIEILRGFLAEAFWEENLVHAFAPFLQDSERESELRTVAFGSLYFIGEVKRLFL